MNNLNNKVVLVTGSSRVLGRAIAERYAFPVAGIVSMYYHKK